METINLIEGDWYSAQYQSEFSIIFQVISINDNTISLRRKDGIVFDSVPSGYIQIQHHGTEEPEYTNI